MSSRNTPPYGAPLKKLIDSGKRPFNTISVWIGAKAWHKGQNFSQSYPLRTLVIPPWQSPYSYIYPVLQCETIIYDTGYAEDDYVDELAFCLFRDGATKVLFVSPEYKIHLYKKDFNDDVTKG